MQPPTTIFTPEVETPPDHTQLPDQDGTFVQNFQEYPQSELLTGSLQPRLRELHPDGLFCIGQDNGIYWRWTQPPLDGCKAPDWFYVPGVPPMLEGQLRRSYVLWREVISPLLVIEYVSGDGSEERDATPYRGKFWVYEQGIRADYYAIFEPAQARVEAYHRTNRHYERLEPNAAGRIRIDPLRVEVGIWEGEFRGMRTTWLRFWDAATGEMLPHTEEILGAEQQRAETAESLLDDARRSLQEECERAEVERHRADEEARLKEAERRRAEKFAEKLRAAGIDPNAE